MALDLILNNSDEFEDLISNQDERVSNAVVDVILKNLKGKKRHLHVKYFAKTTPNSRKT